MDGTVFVDTNVFLRFFVNDVAAQYEKARVLFEAAEAGKIKLETSELVIAEIVWVLESFYGFARKEVTEVLSTLLSRSCEIMALHKSSLRGPPFGPKQPPSAEADAHRGRCRKVY